MSVLLFDYKTPIFNMKYYILLFQVREVVTQLDLLSSQSLIVDCVTKDKFNMVEFTSESANLRINLSKKRWISIIFNGYLHRIHIPASPQNYKSNNDCLIQYTQYGN